jgi:hypothetical protein
VHVLSQCSCDVRYDEWWGKGTNLIYVKIDLCKELQNEYLGKLGSVCILSRHQNVARKLLLFLIIFFAETVYHHNYCNCYDCHIIIVVIVLGKMIIQALPEIPTKGLTLDDLDSLMERTRNIMCETFQSLLTEVTAQTPPTYPSIKQ